MAKGVLSFNLPEDNEEFEVAQKAGDYKAALLEIHNEVFRARRKYAELSSENRSFIEELEAEFYRIINEWNIEI